MGSGCDCTTGYVTVTCREGFVKYIPVYIRNNAVTFDLIDNDVDQLNLIDFAEYGSLKTFTFTIDDNSVCTWLTNIRSRFDTVKFINKKHDQCPNEVDNTIHDGDDEDHELNPDTIEVVRIDITNAITLMILAGFFFIVSWIGVKIV